MTLRDTTRGKGKKKIQNKTQEQQKQMQTQERSIKYKIFFQVTYEKDFVQLDFV